MPASADVRRFAVLIPLLLITALAMSLLPTQTADAATRKGRQIHNAWQVAGNQKGDPYSYGGDGPNRFDCSGLTQFAYEKAGLYLPRTSDEQANYARKIRKRNLQVGDLMIFTDGGDVYHLGMFTGRRDGKAMILHASEPGTDVKRDPVWTSEWFAATVRPR